jgi:hypothetical protein
MDMISRPRMAEEARSWFHPIYSSHEFFFMLLSTSRSGGTPLEIGIVVIDNYAF